MNTPDLAVVDSHTTSTAERGDASYWHVQVMYSVDVEEGLSATYHGMWTRIRISMIAVKTNVRERRAVVLSAVVYAHHCRSNMFSFRLCHGCTFRRPT